MARVPSRGVAISITASLPDSLEPLQEALTLSAVRTRPEGYRSQDFEHAPFVEGRWPPYDGRYWSSFVESGICIRLELEHDAVAPALAAELRRRFAEQIGSDGALYEYERGTRSQHRNREHALTRLGERVAACIGAL